MRRPTARAHGMACSLTEVDAHPAVPCAVTSAAWGTSSPPLACSFTDKAQLAVTKYIIFPPSPRVVRRSAARVRGGLGGFGSSDGRPPVNRVPGWASCSSEGRGAAGSSWYDLGAGWGDLGRPESGWATPSPPQAPGGQLVFDEFCAAPLSGIEPVLPMVWSLGTCCSSLQVC